MAHYLIEGGHPLNGHITPSGNKNEALPALVACLLSDQPVTLQNMPRIADVITVCDILQSIGVSVEWNSADSVTLVSKNMFSSFPPEELCEKARASILLLGPILARFGKIKLPLPGGDVIGARRIDTHWEGMEALGAVLKFGKFIEGKLDHYLGGEIFLDEPSVTATENAILLGALAQGRTTIHLAAQEPHVQDLIAFLDSAGANIHEKPGNKIVIKGVKKLHSVAHRIIPDMIETGTMAVAGALVGKGIVLYGVEPNHLSIVLHKLKEIGVKFELNRSQRDAALKILPSKNLKPFKLQTLPHPGFPTDLQEPFTLLASQASGVSLIHDPLFEDRMKHIPELIKMGAQAIMCDPHRAIIVGKTPLTAYELKSSNIRAGGMLVIAGLLADGETVIHDVENTIDRGYERFDERLNELGAGIRRV